MATVADYDLTRAYAGTKLDCDLVMKGGITSGVIYPLAICKLAESYRFHSIGGASAGAIAAAAAAAAEYGRQNKDQGAGFKQLETLPGKLGEPLAIGTRLRSLFQPAPATRTAFEMLVAGIGDKPLARRVLGVLGVLITRQPVIPTLGLFLSAFIAWAMRNGGALGLVIAAIAILLVLAASVIGTAIVALLGANRAIAENGGGMCSGLTMEGEAEPALTAWLTTLFDNIAGKPHDEPLTFGDLESADIKLEMITTNLTYGHPHRVPLDDAGEVFYFKRSEIRGLFPAPVVTWMERHARLRIARAPELAAMCEGDTYLPFPERADLPVIVGVRLSLSFPLLISAIPLYSVDYTRYRHPSKRQSESSRQNANLVFEENPRLERCWFSDGGICSNLPIHFFDNLLPTRPTFALDLRSPHHNYPVHLPIHGASGTEFEAERTELDNVWIPESPNGGFAEHRNRLEHDGLPVASLVGSMIGTMQNWNDYMLTRAPGYRDRVVQISHTEHEGGLNLDMPPEVIQRLSQRGAAAGCKVARRFVPPAGWSQHLWVRYRSALGMVQNLLGDAHGKYFASDEKRKPLDRLLADPPPFTRGWDDEHAAAAATVNTELKRFPALSSTQIDFERGGPTPWCDLRSRPRGA